MALVSDRNPESAEVNEETGVRVIDTIQMKESYGIAHSPGVVAILDDFRPSDPNSFIGKMANIQSVSGSQCPALVDAVRDHGKTISLFFRGLTPEDVPIGSIIYLPS